MEDYGKEMISVLENTKEKYIKQKIPYFSIIYAFILLIMFIAQCIIWDFNPFTETNFSIKDINEIDLALVYPDDIITEDHYLWQYYTYSLLHRNIVHLVFNVLLFLFFSIFLERKYKWYIVLVVNTFGIISSSFIFVVERMYISDSDSRITLLGASGGVYAMIGMSISEAILNPEFIKRKWLKITMSLIFLLAHILEHILLADTPEIAVWGHFGGLIFGLVPTFIIIPNYKLKNHECIFKTLALISLLVIFLVLPMLIYY